MTGYLLFTLVAVLVVARLRRDDRLTQPRPRVVTRPMLAFCADCETRQPVSVYARCARCSSGAIHVEQARPILAPASQVLVPAPQPAVAASGGVAEGFRPLPATKAQRHAEVHERALDRYARAKLLGCTVSREVN